MNFRIGRSVYIVDYNLILLILDIRSHLRRKVYQ